MKRRWNPFSVLRYVVLSVTALLTLYPLFWIGICSLKSSEEIYGSPFGLPKNPEWENYAESFVAADIPIHLFNSIMYAVVSLTAVVILSSMSAYIIAKVWKSKRVYNYYSLGIMIPINAIIIPFILIFRSVGILNTRVGIILAFIVTNLAFSIFIFVPFMEGLPDELEDAARIDGCNRFQTFVKIMLPLSKAGLATVGTFVLINCWNDLFLSLLIVSKQNLITLNQVCYNMKSQYAADYGLITATVMIMVIPVIVCYALFQKQIVKGMTAGSVKG